MTARATRRGACGDYSQATRLIPERPSRSRAAPPTRRRRTARPGHAGYTEAIKSSIRRMRPYSSAAAWPSCHEGLSSSEGGLHQRTPHRPHGQRCADRPRQHPGPGGDYAAPSPSTATRSGRPDQHATMINGCAEKTDLPRQLSHRRSSRTAVLTVVGHNWGDQRAFTFRIEWRWLLDRIDWFAENCKVERIWVDVSGDH